MASKRTYPPFKFKQFTVSHDKSAMKLGVDSVLLSCWVPTQNYHNILDVGTGCGIISLVLAQRIDKASIKAVEIEKNAFEEAKFNFEHSPWNNRLKAFHEDFESYFSRNEEKFDLVIANPPYFLNSLKAEETARSTARHAIQFNFKAFFKLAFYNTTIEGKVALVFPYEQADFLINNAKLYGWNLERQTSVYPMPHKKIKRALFLFSKEEKESINDYLTIEKERGTYTVEYSELVKDFYLHF